MRMGGYYDNDYKFNNYKQKSINIEKGGLIPITAKILKEISISTEDTLEYLGVQLYDVYIVGNLLEVTELDTKTKIKIWDHTGLAEIVFYLKNEFENINSVNVFGDDS